MVHFGITLFFRTLWGENGRCGLEFDGPEAQFFNFLECVPFDITLFFRTLWGEIGRPLLEFGVRKVQFSLFVNVPLST